MELFLHLLVQTEVGIFIELVSVACVVIRLFCVPTVALVRPAISYESLYLKSLLCCCYCAHNLLLAKQARYLLYFLGMLLAVAGSN